MKLISVHVVKRHRGYNDCDCHGKPLIWSVTVEEDGKEYSTDFADSLEEALVTLADDIERAEWREREREEAERAAAEKLKREQRKAARLAAQADKLKRLAIKTAMG